MFFCFTFTGPQNILAFICGSVMLAHLIEIQIRLAISHLQYISTSSLSVQAEFEQEQSGVFSYQSNFLASAPWRNLCLSVSCARNSHSNIYFRMMWHRENLASLDRRVRNFLSYRPGRHEIKIRRLLHLNAREPQVGGQENRNNNWCLFAVFDMLCLIQQHDDWLDLAGFCGICLHRDVDVHSALISVSPTQSSALNAVHLDQSKIRITSAVLLCTSSEGLAKALIHASDSTCVHQCSLFFTQDRRLGWPSIEVLSDQIGRRSGIFVH